MIVRSRDRPELVHSKRFSRQQGINDFYSAGSIAAENANNAGNFASYKPEAQAKGIDKYGL